MHKELLNEFSILQQKPWVNKMIKDFIAKNKPL